MIRLKKIFKYIRTCFLLQPEDVNSDSFKGIQKVIQYTFKNKKLLQLALTHKSSIAVEDDRLQGSNERLEFLGDAVLNFLVTDYLYSHYPHYSEGQLSKIKSLLVSRKIMGELGLQLNLGLYLIMAQSEQRSGGHSRTSVVSNAVEALLGAIYLDSSIVEVRTLLNRLLFNRIEELINDTDNINYKSKILEMSQKDGFGVPLYQVLEEQGPDHAKQFRIAIDIAGVRMGEGVGSNKKVAQQNAAYNAIINYNKDSIQITLQRSKEQ